MSVPIEQLMTVDELELMPDDGNRYEVIEGELFVTRAPNLEHQVITSNLDNLIGTYLGRNPIGSVVPGAGVVFTKFSGVIPDQVFFTHTTGKKAVSGGRLKAAPDLVIEIVSPGADNRRRDRVVKRNLYAKHGVLEYWIVDYKARTIEVYQLSEKTLVLSSKLNEREKLTSLVLPGFSCTVADVFAVPDYLR